MQLSFDLFPLQSLPRKIAVAQTVIDNATAHYSADTLQENKIRGLFSYLNRSWICTGYSQMGDRRISVNLVEALEPEQWTGITHTRSKQFTRGNHFYTGRLITFRGRSLVMGSRKVTLLAKDFRPNWEE